MDLLSQELRLDTAGTLLYDPPEMGRASAATVIIYDPDGVQHVASQSATIDTANTTLSAGASAGASTVTVTATTGITVGRRYLLTAAAGHREWARVVSVNTSTKVVTLAESLHYAYASADTFVGTRLSVAVSAVQATPRAEGYEARWSYTIASVAYYGISLFNIVRYPWPERILQTWEFKEHAGSLSGPELELASRAGLAFSDEIDTATDQVREDIRAKGYEPGRFKSALVFRRAVCARVLLTWAEQGINIPRVYQDTPDDWRTQAAARYETTLSAALTHARNYDSDDSGTLTSDERDARLGSMRIIL